MEVLSPGRMEATTMPSLSLFESCWCSQILTLLLWVAPSISWLVVPMNWWNALHQIYPQKHCTKSFYWLRTALKCLQSKHMSLDYWKTQDEPTMIYQLQPSKQLCKNTALESVHAQFFTLSLAWLFIKTGAEVLIQLLRTSHNKRHAISREKALPWIFPYTVKMKEGNNESCIHQLCDSYRIANLHEHDA